MQEYILDFYCPEHRLAVELDGESHFTPEGVAHDMQRAKILTALGIRVLRFTNVEAMKNREGIWQTISEAIEGRKV